MSRNKTTANPENHRHSAARPPLSLSYEFFPPRQPNQQRRFWRTVGCLETLQPTFFSVTYGALGSASEASLGIVSELINESETPVAAHLTCGGQTPDQVALILDRLEALGIRHIVALRGDRTEPGETVSGGGQPMRYATDLLHLLQQRPAARRVAEISVAAYPEIHPEAANATADLDNLKRKFDAGATRALTQYFYDCDAFLRFRDMAVAAGISNPIVPGLLPVHDIDKVVDFSARCGAKVPESLIARFRPLGNDTAAKFKAATEHGLGMCDRLISEGVTDFHFYTLNQSDLAYEISKELIGISVPESSAA